MNSFQTKKNLYWDFFFKEKPIKLTEARYLKLHDERWGLLTEFYLESVKINKINTGEMCSAATLKVSDRAGQIICVAKGHIIGLLFDLTPQEWSDVEKLNCWGDQLFYRYFKNGIKSSFSYEHKLFYNFCMSNQTQKPLAVVFRRTSNMRNVDRNNAVLEILEMRHCNEQLLDLYLDHIKKSQTVDS
ncbi:unnamed protein product [Diatraea saccharalis]|uniref:Uncharacterized protein n=1 Tax=Diatraea saccharalis TaxID=40085 RepID=A0A9N9QUP9_9NEOP|nr:unnamed protein product [Diatraea saccharalis]